MRDLFDLVLPKIRIVIELKQVITAYIMYIFKNVGWFPTEMLRLTLG